MPMLARHVMTPDPACCTPATTLDEVAKLMCAHDCGAVPVIDRRDHIVGIITDRDLVCRVVAAGMNPIAHTADRYMSQPVITVRLETSLDEVLRTMQRHQIRRLPVVDAQGRCAGIISQADIAREWIEHDVAALVRDISKDPKQASDLPDHIPAQDGRELPRAQA